MQEIIGILARDIHQNTEYRTGNQKTGQSSIIHIHVHIYIIGPLRDILLIKILDTV